MRHFISIIIACLFFLPEYGFGQEGSKLLSEVYKNGEIENEYIYENQQAVEIWQRRYKEDSGLYYHFGLSYNNAGLIDTVVLRDDSLDIVISKSIYEYDKENRRKKVIWINLGQEGYAVDTIYHQLNHYIDRNDKQRIDIESQFVQYAFGKRKINYLERKCTYQREKETLECSTYDYSIFPKLTIYKFDDKNRNPILLSIHNQDLFPINFIPHNLKTVKKNPEGSFANSTFYQYRYNEHGLPTLMRFKDENGKRVKYEFEYQ